MKLVRIEGYTSSGNVSTSEGPRRPAGNAYFAPGSWAYADGTFVYGRQAPTARKPPVWNAKQFILFLESNGYFYGRSKEWSEQFSEALVAPPDDPGDSGTWSYIAMAYNNDRISTIWIAYGDDSASTRFLIKTNGQDDVIVTTVCNYLRGADAYLDESGVLHWVFLDCETSAAAPNCDFSYYTEDELVNTISRDLPALATVVKPLAVNMAIAVGKTAYYTMQPAPEIKTPPASYWDADVSPKRWTPAYFLHRMHLWEASAVIRVVVTARIFVGDDDPEYYWHCGYVYYTHYYDVGSGTLLGVATSTYKLQDFNYFALVYPDPTYADLGVTESESIVLSDDCTVTISMAGIGATAVVLSVGDVLIEPNESLLFGTMWGGISCGTDGKAVWIVGRGYSNGEHRVWVVDLETGDVAEATYQSSASIVNSRLPLRSTKISQ